MTQPQNATKLHHHQEEKTWCLHQVDETEAVELIPQKPQTQQNEPLGEGPKEGGSDEAQHCPQILRQTNDHPSIQETHPGP